MGGNPPDHRRAHHQPATQPTKEIGPSRTRHRLPPLPRRPTRRMGETPVGRMAAIHRHMRPRTIRTPVQQAQGRIHRPGRRWRRTMGRETLRSRKTRRRGQQSTDSTAISSSTAASTCTTRKTTRPSTGKSPAPPQFATSKPTVQANNIASRRACTASDWKTTENPAKGTPSTSCPGTMSAWPTHCQSNSTSTRNPDSGLSAARNSSPTSSTSSNKRMASKCVTRGYTLCQPVRRTASNAAAGRTISSDNYPNSTKTNIRHCRTNGGRPSACWNPPTGKQKGKKHNVRNA